MPGNEGQGTRDKEEGKRNKEQGKREKGNIIKFWRKND